MATMMYEATPFQKVSYIQDPGIQTQYLITWSSGPHRRTNLNDHIIFFGYPQALLGKAPTVRIFERGSVVSLSAVSRPICVAVRIAICVAVCIAICAVVGGPTCGTFCAYVRRSAGHTSGIDETHLGTSPRKGCHPSLWQTTRWLVSD